VPFALPSLDTRTYSDLIAEAKQRIPRYLPEWTDLNESDPGIALVELFAWMTEATLYQLNRAPDVLRLKLLQLLGFGTRPAQPARTELQFVLAAGVDSIVIPSGTRVASSGVPYPDGSPVIFETDDAVVAIGPVLQAALAMKAGAPVPFFSDPGKPKSLPFVPFPLAVASGETDALYLCFTYPKPFPDVDVDLALFLDDAPGDAGSYTCTFGKPPTPPATWTWEYLDSVTGAWRAANMLADETAALYRSGHVRFRFPSAPAVNAEFAGRTEPQLADYVKLTGVWVRARLTSASYEQAPSLVAITTNTAPATAAITVRDETIGGSYGTASQSFTLAHAPVLAGTLVVTIDEGLGGQPAVWQAVPDFYGSSPGAEVYTLDTATGTITFGDNHFGAIPLANPTTQNNIVATTYRYGGGFAGNTGSGTITDLQSYVAYVDSVTNPIAAHGGADEEPLDETILRAGHDVRATNRAVTADDFEALALETPGALVARAHTLPLTDPAFSGLEIPGSVTVLVIPQRTVDVDVTLQDVSTGPPAPNRTTLEAVCAWLDAHRLVTTELHVAGPRYRILRFSMTAYCTPDADLAACAQGIVSALRARFAPVGPGGGWAWGATAYAALAFTAAMSVPNVSRIDSDFKMTLDGTPLPTLGDAQIGPAELFWVPVDGVAVTPRYETAP
jgi:predicted phage baseplate assembly protein